MREPTHKPGREIVSHTSMRGFAAFLVAIYHHRYLFPDFWENVVLARFYVFVDLFFILSGFIIAYCYFNAFRDAPSAGQILRFLQKRLARIYPLHIVTLMFFAVLPATAIYSGTLYTGGAVEIGGQDFWSSLFLMQGWGLTSGPTFNHPSWSISGEWAAYLAFPIFVWVGARGRGALLLLGFVVLLYGVQYRAMGGLHLKLELTLFRALPGFALGIVVYLATGWWNVSGRQISGLQVAVVVGIAGVILGNLGDMWLLPLFALLVFLTCQDRGILGQALGWGVFYRLGLWSYSIYLLHVPVLELAWQLRAAFPQSGFLWADINFALLSLGATLALSALSYRYLEMPSRNLLSGAPKRQELFPGDASKPPEHPRARRQR